MKKPGRKNAADAMTVVSFEGYRPDPPSDLAAEQVVVWKAVVAAMPAEWFRPETHGLLTEYCRHVCRSRLLARVLDHAEPEQLETVQGLDHYNKFAAAAERETRAMLATARALRLTPQARLDPKTAHRQLAAEPLGPKPWEYP
jgi:phage terminase small subunit